MNRLIQSAMLIATVASASAWAQGKLDRTPMQPFGGTYRSFAQHAASLKEPFDDSLVFVQDGGKAVLTGRNVQARSPSSSATHPPPEF